MKILVIDAQGGGIGRQLVTGIRERIPDGDVRGTAFSCAVFPNRFESTLLKMLARIEPAVALKIELKPA